jgi:hypothetical protein
MLGSQQVPPAILLGSWQHSEISFSLTSSSVGGKMKDNTVLSEVSMVAVE